MTEAEPQASMPFPLDQHVCAPHGGVRHCCSTNHRSLGNLAQQSAAEIWNGALYQQVRRRVAAGDFAGALCDPTCEALRTGAGFPWPGWIRGGDALEKNERAALESFQGGQIEVAHLPTQLKIEFTNICNLRCVMCFYDFTPPYKTVPERAISQPRDLSRLATHVALMGGEVFVNRHDLEFLRSYEPPEGGSVGFVTNGSCLNDENIELLKKFRRVGMQISIDGTTKDVFETIRVRGKWEEVDGNIRRIVSLLPQLAEQGYEWSVQLTYVVMKSNLLDLPHAVRYAAELGVPIRFNLVKGGHLFTENVFLYRELLESVHGWRSAFDSALATVDGLAQNYRYAHAMRSSLLEIRRYLDAPKADLPLGFLASAGRWTGRAREVGRAAEMYADWRLGSSSLLSTLVYVARKARQRAAGRLGRLRWAARGETRV